MKTATRGVGTPVYMVRDIFLTPANRITPIQIHLRSHQKCSGEEKMNNLPVDIYALGIIMWQLWFKQTPWKNKSVFGIINAVVRGKRPPPRQSWGR